MGWGVLGDIADGAKDIAGGAVDFVDDKARDAGKAFDAAVDGARDAVVDTAGDVAKGVGRTVSNASISDIGHTALDVAGMVPVIGEAADLANAGWYLAEGDKVNAALSAAGAIPFAGNAATAAKWGRKAVNAADVVGDTARIANNAGDVAKVANNAGDAARAAGTVGSVAKAGDDVGPQVLFGQKRIGESFGSGGGRPSYLDGRPISDVASDLRAGRIQPDQIEIKAFQHGDKLVSTNNRSLAALSDAGMTPTNVKVVQPTRNELARLKEAPIIADAPLPGNRIPVTPSQEDLTVLRVISTPF